MRESLKNVCILVIFVGIIAAVGSWMSGSSNQLVWVFRIGSLFIIIVSLAVFLLVHFQRDKAPDYLHQFCGKFFDRGGFCFTFDTRSEEGICFVDAFFQNRHERSCVGRIALRPTRKSFKRHTAAIITCEIHCEPAAFGVARIPMPVDPARQGKRQKFEVGASVDYPQGKGNALRFRDGMLIRTNSNFGDAFGTALTVAGALGGSIVLSSPATVTLNLPVDVAEDIPKELTPQIQTLWKMGDTPLQPEGDNGTGLPRRKP